MNTNDCHYGTVIRRYDDKVVAAISTDSRNCDGCAASMLCRRSSDIEVEISVGSRQFEIGQTVAVKAVSGADLQALMLFFIYPFILFFSSLAILTYLDFRQIVSAITALALTGAYYAAAVILRKRIKPVIWKISDS